MNFRTLGAAAMLLTAYGAAAQPLTPTMPVSVLRLDDPVEITQGGETRPLRPDTVLTPGDVISASTRGKVELQFAGSGRFTLSNLGELQVFEAQLAKGKQPALAKLKLLGGALRVDSRAAKGKAGQDIRLNVGSLKTRITNAEAWAANTAEGDTLCLLAGRVSVQTDGSAEERLIVPGSCLRREPDGQLSRFTAESDAVVVGAIDATRFTSEAIPLPLPAKVSPSAPIIASAPLRSADLAPTPAASAPVASPAAAPAPPAADSRGWTVVVLSLSRPEPVAERAKALTEQGLPASSRSATVNGMTMHRVVVGQFTTQAAARDYATQTLAKAGIKGWAAPL